jgi:outer membrane protein OmpA-like peptidoglycan-associated protein
MIKKMLMICVALSLFSSLSLLAQEEKKPGGEELLKAIEETKEEVKTLPKPTPTPIATPAPVPTQPPEDKNLIKETQEESPKQAVEEPKKEAVKEPEEKKEEVKAEEKKGPKESKDIKATLLAPALYGQTGNYRVYSAQRQPASSTSFNLSMHGEWFRQKNFINIGDDVSRVTAIGAITYTPIKYLEISTAMFGFTNRGSSNATLLQRMGDLRVGTKLGLDLGSVVSVGTNFFAEILNGAGDAGVTGNGYSYDLRALLTMDFMQSYEVPIKLHFNGGYRWDKTSKASGFNLSTLDRTTQFFLNVMPKNQITFGIGFEVPIEFVTLFAEYTSEQVWDVSYGNNPQRITTGLRIFPSENQDISFDVGTDVAIMNSNKTARIIGVPAYNLIFGMTVSKFPVAPKAVAILPTTGSLRGIVTDTEAKQPIGDVLVSVDDGAVNNMLTKGDGTYQTLELPAGPHRIVFSKDGYEPATVNPEVIAGQSIGIDVLLAKKKAEKGAVIFKIFNADDKPISGTIEFLDYPNLKPYAVDMITRGGLKVNLKAGNYKVRIGSSKYISEEKVMTVEAGKESIDKNILREIVEKVKIEKDKIVIKDKVHFATGKAEILTDSLSLLNRVADLISDHSELKKIRVEGHTDSTGSPKFNKDLSQKRAEAVREYLLIRGINADRVEAVGYGMEVPIAPNSTKQGRAINRRVEFTIVEENMPELKSTP